MKARIYLLAILLISSATAQAGFPLWGDSPQRRNINDPKANNYSPPSAPTPVPRQGKIAFRSGRDGSDQIYVMNPDGSNQTRITYNTEPVGWNYDNRFCWAPDGSKIAVSDSDGDLYVINADGSNQINLTNSPVGYGWPCWSPDGTKIAFNRGGVNSGISLINADGSNPVLLVGDGNIAPGPCWSPNSSKIAFMSTRDGYVKVYVWWTRNSVPFLLV